jgi:hypothetical protein
MMIQARRSSRTVVFTETDALLQILSPQQQIELKHNDDFLTKIPRCAFFSVMLWAYDV